MNKRLFHIVLLVLFSTRLISQNSFDPISTPIENTLPNLVSLIDSAILNSTLLKIKNSQIIIKQLNEVSEKRKWLELSTLDAQVTWGKYDNFTNGNLSSVTTVTTSNQIRFGSGFTLRIPLYNIFMYGLNNKIAKQETKIITLEFEQQKRELKTLIIKQYNDLLLAQRILIIKNENKQAHELLMNLSDSQFSSGELDLKELTTTRQLVSKAREEFQNARSILFVTYLLLQESVGIQFNIL